MEEDEILFELGDTVLLVGGQINGLRGRIYYIDDTLIRILPDGVSDRLVDIPIIDGDLDPALKIDHLYSVSKRISPAFVAQINAEVGELAETFDKDGTPATSYKITEINEATDTMTLTDETGGELIVNADFTGIPQDLPFAVLRPRPTAEEEDIAAAGIPVEEPADYDEEFEDVLDTEIKEAPDAELDVDEIKEVPSSQRVYSDAIQRNDMLQEMVSFLDKTSQKNPERHKQIRTVVEQCMLLRNTIIEYNKSGEPIGSFNTSLLTVADLVATNAVPLSRPVLKANRVLYLDHTPESLEKTDQGDPPTDPTEVPDADVVIRYLDEVVNETVEYMKTQLGGISSAPLSPDTLPEWYLSWDTLNRVFHSTWTVSGDERPVPFTKDTEFLRYPVIDTESPFVDGLPSLDASAKVLITADQVTKIRMSLLRGLGPRMGRLKEKEPPRRVEVGEEGAVVSTLIFPLSEQQYLGATRSGVIAKDIVFSCAPKQTVMEIIERLEGIPDRPTAGGILLVGEDGNTNGSISLDDWLASQPLHPLGLADAIVELASYGFTNTELNADQQEVIVRKIDGYRALIKQFIVELRDRMAKVISEQTMTENPFLVGESYKLFTDTIKSEPLLESIMTGLKNTTPVYKTNDIATVAAILRSSADLFLATMAQVSGPLARERNRRVRDQYIQALLNALQKTEINALSVYIPEPNNCAHVGDYTIIQKQKDLEIRMKLFAKFITRYEGTRKNNWVNCNVCKEHLACYHEVLLLKEYLYPKEKSELHKELLLNFSGGVFQGKFICKVCGQQISEMDYDTSIEYSDDGTPISGRAVLEAEPEIKDVLDALLGEDAQGAAEDEITFKSELQRIIYTAAKRLFDVVGIYAKTDTLKRVLQRAENEMVKQPTAAAYKESTKGKRVIDYQVYINRIMVASVAANCLLEIQTNIPGFVVRYKLAGCRAGFSGFPVGNEKDMTGVEYIVCATASIRDDVAPWNLTGYQGESEKRRTEAIQSTMMKVLAATLNGAAVQLQISKKREYLNSVFGSVMQSEQLSEKIPAGFRPVPYAVSKEDATKAPSVPEAATPSEKIRGWITLAHQIGVDTGNVVKGNPFSDATCCLAPIQDPGKFWREAAAALPSLPLKAPPQGPMNSHVSVHFDPRPYETLVGSVPADIMYRIFLKVCYEGPNKGLPHEPGYTNVCASCGFVFPENPYAVMPFPPIGSKELAKEYAEEIESIVSKGKVALQTQGIKTSATTFESVLDATHRAFKVVPYQAVRPAAGMKLFEQFRTMDPEPFEGWRELITGTMAQLSSLPAGPNKIDIATAYGALSDFGVQRLDMLKERLGIENAATLQQVLEGSVSQAAEAVLAYILIPFQRLAAGFQTGSLKVPKGYELGSGTEEDINRNLESHLLFVSQLAKRATGLTLEKIKWTIQRLSKAIVILKQNVRSAFIPGGEIGLPYVVVALVAGILTNFIDPDFIPVEGEMVDAGAKAPIQILDVCLQKMRKEGLKFTNEAIKEMISRRDEIEKNLFIRRFENLTPQEKAMAKRIKQLGLKEWAIGGTNAIQRYDSDQYEVERQQRADMGFTEMFEGGGTEEGYDNAQIAEDDY